MPNISALFKLITEIVKVSQNYSQKKITIIHLLNKKLTKF